MKTELTEKFIDNYCQEKRYNIKKTPNKDFLRIEVSNLTEQISLNLYKTGTLTVGGSPKTKLKPEFDLLKTKIQDSPEILGGIEKPKVKACATKYKILHQETRDLIKDSITDIDGNSQFYDKPTPSEQYRAKLSDGDQSLSVTQYNNGTLLIQGKEDSLFSKTCDLVENKAVPTEQEVISRFLAGDEESLQKFVLAYTPQLLDEAEKQIRSIIGNEIFDFLEIHDQKWLVASECLKIANIPLPEFSPLVMPASKTFEGFIKKLLVHVGFYPANHFAAKNSTFAYLNDPNHASRKTFVARDKHADTFLKKINVCLDTNRNFMMHSDGASITKLDTYEEATEKLEAIFDDMKEIYTYFKGAGVLVYKNV